jgi:hypothetical protein
MRWWEEYENILNLVRHLIEKGTLTRATAVLQIFEKPWKWETEWNEYQKQEKVAC